MLLRTAGTGLPSRRIPLRRRGWPPPAVRHEAATILAVSRPVRPALPAPCFVPNASPSPSRFAEGRAMPAQLLGPLEHLPGVLASCPCSVTAPFGSSLLSP